MSSPKGKVVDSTEYVYRRIHTKHFDKRLAMPVFDIAFRPTDSDEDGISLVRVSSTSSPTDALVDVDPEKIGNYHVAKLPVSLFHELGLTVMSSETEKSPGHAHSPELNAAAYNSKSTKRILKDKMIELAKVAGQNIVYSPPVESS